MLWYHVFHNVDPECLRSNNVQISQINVATMLLQPKIVCWEILNEYGRESEDINIVQLE